MIKKIKLFFAAMIILLAILASTIRLLTPWLSQYKSQVENQLSVFFDRKVSIKHIKAAWYHFEPVIQMDGIDIQADKTHKQAISIKRLSVGIDLWRSLTEWGFQPGLFLIDGASFDLSNGHSKLLTGTDGRHRPIYQRLNKLVKWFLQQDEVVVKNISVKLNYKQTPQYLLVKRVVLINHDNQHQIKGVAQLDKENPSWLTLVAKLEGDELFDQSGRFYLTIKNSKLLNRAGLHYKSLSVDKATLNLKSWVDIKNSKIDSFHGVMALTNLLLRNNKTNHLKIINKGEANFHFQSIPNGFLLKADNLSFSSLFPLKNSTLYFRYDDKKTIIQVGNTKVKGIAHVAQFLRLPYQQWLADAVPHGTLETVQLVLKKQLFHQLIVRFKNLSWSHPSLISASRLSGILFSDRHAGYLQLHSQHGTLSFPHDKHVFFFDKFDSVVKWQRINHIWRVASDHFYLTSKNGRISTQFAFDWAKTFLNSYLSLTSQFSLNRLEEYKPYLGRFKLKPKLYNWLNNGVISLPNVVGELSINGQLKDFPFDNKEGVFALKAHMTNATLKYHKEWPIAEKIFASIDINGRTFKANVEKASLGDNDVGNIHVKIKPLGKKPELQLTGHVKAKIKSAKSYVLKTPLIKELSNLANFHFKGMMGLKIDLKIPLYPENNTNIVSGRIDFLDNQVKLPKQWHTELSKLEGPLHFNQDGILKSQLKAKLLGYGVSLKMYHKNQKQKTLYVSAKGFMNIERLKSSYDIDILNYMRGMFPYHLDIALPHHSKETRLSIASNMKGLGVNLPAPFFKPLETSTPLTIQLIKDEKKAIYRYRYGTRTSGVFQFLRKNELSKFDKGEIRLGHMRALLPKSKGLKVVGNLNELNIIKWLDFIKNQKQIIRHDDTTTRINEVDLFINKVVFGSHPFENMSIKLIANKNRYDIRLSNNLMRGHIEWPRTNDKELLLNFDKLYLNDKLMQATPKGSRLNMPKIRLKARDFRFNTIYLGVLEMEVLKESGNSKINSMVLTSPSYKLSLNGLSKKIAHGRRSKVEGRFVSRDFSQSLKQWGMDPVIYSNNTDMQFNLFWPGKFSDITLSKLNGKLKIELKKGRITHLNKDTEKKLAFGKILSILSLQTLPRRLSLDFSDLSHKGYSFDIFKGDFVLRLGQLNTQNGYLNGPVAKANITGGIDLSKKHFALRLDISPHITASLPVVATIAGGPVAGIATWVASKIINQGIDKVSAYSYQVSGPWAHPIVQQIGITRTRHH